GVNSVSLAPACGGEGWGEGVRGQPPRAKSPGNSTRGRPSTPLDGGGGARVGPAAGDGRQHPQRGDPEQEQPQARIEPPPLAGRARPHVLVLVHQRGPRGSAQATSPSASTKLRRNAASKS